MLIWKLALMWCVALQPWRYMDAGVRARGGEETSAVSVDATWQQFVAENILFYTSLLKLLLLRSLNEFFCDFFGIKTVT
jgi:hypothetical protein